MKNLELLVHSSAAYRLMWGSIDQMVSFFCSFLLPGSLYAYWELPPWRWEVNLSCIFCKCYLSKKLLYTLHREIFADYKFCCVITIYYNPLWSGEGDSLQFPEWTGNCYHAAVSSFAATHMIAIRLPAFDHCSHCVTASRNVVLFIALAS
jgi:hypothetical protein